MIPVEKAQQLIREQLVPRSSRRVTLDRAVGLVLAEDVPSDIHSPPHDKAMVDGYAVRTADLASPGAQLTVLEEITAGLVPRHAVTAGSATRIMTGAPVPEGADAVVMIEQTETNDDQSVTFNVHDVQPGANILRWGTSMREGEIVLEQGEPLRATQVGLLGEVGRARVEVIPRPKVAIVATGNELVPTSQMPDLGKIRNSNSPLLSAAVAAARCEAVDLGIARDEPHELKRVIELGFQYDIVLLSGGVSAGVLDLVPACLRELGVEEVFHKVRVKPGKPLWFGVKQHPQGTRAVFGLPGNPVSSFVCFHLFTRVAIEQLAGVKSDPAKSVTARLTREYKHKGKRRTYYPASLSETAEGATVEPLSWYGSADLRHFADANALAIFPEGTRTYSDGEMIDVLPL